MHEHDYEILSRIESKLDAMLAMRRIEKKIDLLLADRMDRDKVAAAGVQIDKVSDKLADAVAEATPTT